MKKYLGTAMTFLGAIVSLCFVLCPVILGASMLAVEIDLASICVFAMCLSCSVLWACYMWKIKNQLYSWGKFNAEAINVFVPFQKQFTIEYSKCKGCGIGMYRHAFMNSQNSTLGSNIYFIFLSLDPFPEKYRTQINLWKPSQRQIKVQFSAKLYSYLMNVLPKKQELMLKADYEKYIKHE